jgi:glycosyltransferase involved in cell wall biosynthesis
MIAYTNYAIDGRVRREAETLAAQGFRVRCLTTRNGNNPARSELNGVEIQELPIRKYRGKSTLTYLGSYLRFALFSAAACLGLLLRNELDVVHVHNLPDFLVLAGLLPRLGGKKVVLDVHDSVPETFATKFGGGGLLWRVLCLEERLSTLVAHTVICVNHPQRDALAARGVPRAKIFVSMNMPDPSIFGQPLADSQEAPAEAGTFNLVYHGTMAERLGVDLLIDAVARLRDRIPSVRLHLWGNGDDLDAFRRFAQAKRADDLIVFRPQGYSLSELPQHLRHMDVGLVGNRRTTAGDLMLPVKLLEYVSLGIPAIVPRLRTIEHYFTDDMVTYYDPDDVQSLTDSIVELYSNPARRRCQAGSARIFLLEYGWERQGADLVNLYRGLVDTKA